MINLALWLTEESQAVTNASIPSIGFIIWLAGAFITSGIAAGLAGWRIVAIIDARMVKYLSREIAQMQFDQLDDENDDLKSVINRLTKSLNHLHDCMHSLKSDMAILKDRAQRKDAEDEEDKER